MLPSNSLAWDRLQGELRPWLLDAVASMGFSEMAPVQAATVPLLCGNKDVVVDLVTGSGKTLAFVLPVLERVSRALGVEGTAPENTPLLLLVAVVLLPLRELANQIQQVFEEVLRFQPSAGQIRTQLVVGQMGNARKDAKTWLEDRPHVVVATPGRLADVLAHSKAVSTKLVEVVVLDEADKLLDVSNGTDTQTILARLPKQRRTGLFSATLAGADNDTFRRVGMTNPVKVTVRLLVAPRLGQLLLTPALLGISYVVVPAADKIDVLVHLLAQRRFTKAIVYFPTRDAVRYFYGMLRELQREEVVPPAIQLFSLHGGLHTDTRFKMQSAFGDAAVGDGKAVLVTTDVLGRGIDIPDVDLVVLFDPPNDNSQFLHRCGRTGRANRVGQAVVLLHAGREEGYVELMEVAHRVEMAAETVEVAPEAAERRRQVVEAWVRSDRGQFDLGRKLYVGFVRYYSKHQANADTFRLSLVDFVGVARCYGLLQIPAMPELRFVPKESVPKDGWLVEPVDLDTYAFKDAAQEKARVATMASRKAEVAQLKEAAKRKREAQAKNASWSEKGDVKQTRATRREKVKKKREAIEARLMAESSDDDTEADWKELVRDNKRRRQGGGAVGAGLFEGL